jgi:hypothetical protein
MMRVLTGMPRQANFSAYIVGVRLQRIEGIGMHAFFAAILATCLIGSYASASSAAPAGIVAQQNATPFTHPAQYWDHNGSPYPRACPPGYHYECRPGHYGFRHCTCWPNN